MAENPSITIEAGAQFAVPYPFCWDLASKPSDDPEGPWNVEFMSWRPGVRFEPLPPYGDDSDCIADGSGHQILTVISVHKPGRFPTRVFYTRVWRDPRGASFGKGGLRMKTLDAFKRLINGYQHEYRLATGEELLEHEAAELAKKTPPVARAALTDGAA